ncbi:MAG: DNA alkylation repair protein, partial [Candidatus Doudnabacteria bacterium]|nr:DNA alkylation repair protein [Candidatus Doudnabacteria bacterium]
FMTVSNVVSDINNLDLKDLDKLIKSKIHEERLIALLILVHQYQSLNTKSLIFKFYLSRTKHINSWDLVDLSAPNIVGEYLIDKNREILYLLARSKSLWERRIAMLSTFAFIKRGDYADTLKIAKILIKDKHDLIYKATGWMLREVGKRCGEKHLTDFLNRYRKIMPRTMLRYAIERLDQKTKNKFLKI